MIRFYWGGRAFDSFRVKITPFEFSAGQQTKNGYWAVAHAAPANWRTTTAATASSEWSHSSNQVGFAQGEIAKQRPVRNEASWTQNYSYTEMDSLRHGSFPTCRTSNAKVVFEVAKSCYIKMFEFYQKRGKGFLLPRGPNRHCHRFCWASHSKLCVLDKDSLHTLSSWKVNKTQRHQHRSHNINKRAHTCTYNVTSSQPANKPAIASISQSSPSFTRFWAL